MGDDSNEIIMILTIRQEIIFKSENDKPDTSNQNLIDMVTTIGNFLKCKVEPNIDKFQTSILYERNIAIKCTSKIQRDRFLPAAKTTRKINSNHYDIIIHGISDKIFINKHLCPQMNILHKQTRYVFNQKRIRTLTS